MFTAKYDCYGCPPTIGKVVVKTINYCDALCVVEDDGSEHIILEAGRDQWGVFYFLKDTTISQEDTTMSFVDALIKGLQYIKNRNECETTESITEEVEE